MEEAQVQVLKRQNQELLVLRRPNSITDAIGRIPKPQEALPTNPLPLWSNLNLDQKVPIPPAPNGTFIATRTRLCKPLFQGSKCQEFDNVDPYIQETPIQYSPLHDPHLSIFFHTKLKLLNHLIELEQVTPNGQVICTLNELNRYRLYLSRVHRTQISAERKREIEVYLHNIDQLKEIQHWMKKQNIDQRAALVIQRRSVLSLENEERLKLLRRKQTEHPSNWIHELRAQNNYILKRRHDLRRRHVLMRLDALKKSQLRRSRLILINIMCEEDFSQRLRDWVDAERRINYCNDLHNFIQNKHKYQSAKLRYNQALIHRLNIQQKCKVEKREANYKRKEIEDMESFKEKTLRDKQKEDRVYYLMRKYGFRWLNHVFRGRKTRYQSTWHITNLLRKTKKYLRISSGAQSFVTFMGTLLGDDLRTNDPFENCDKETKQAVKYVLNTLVESSYNEFIEKTTECLVNFVVDQARLKCVEQVCSEGLDPNDLVEPIIPKRLRNQIRLPPPVRPCVGPCGEPSHWETRCTQMVKELQCVESEISCKLANKLKKDFERWPGHERENLMKNLRQNVSCARKTKDIVSAAETVAGIVFNRTSSQPADKDLQNDLANYAVDKIQSSVGLNKKIQKEDHDIQTTQSKIGSRVKGRRSQLDQTKEAGTLEENEHLTTIRGSAKKAELKTKAPNAVENGMQPTTISGAGASKKGEPKIKAGESKNQFTNKITPIPILIEGPSDVKNTLDLDQAQQDAEDTNSILTLDHFDTTIAEIKDTSKVEPEDRVPFPSTSRQELEKSTGINSHEQATSRQTEALKKQSETIEKKSSDRPSLSVANESSTERQADVKDLGGEIIQRPDEQGSGSAGEDEAEVEPGQKVPVSKQEKSNSDKIPLRSEILELVKSTENEPDADFMSEDSSTIAKGIDVRSPEESSAEPAANVLAVDDKQQQVEEKLKPIVIFSIKSVKHIDKTGIVDGESSENNKKSDIKELKVDGEGKVSSPENAGAGGQKPEEIRESHPATSKEEPSRSVGFQPEETLAKDILQFIQPEAALIQDAAEAKRSGTQVDTIHETDKSKDTPVVDSETKQPPAVQGAEFSSPPMKEPEQTALVQQEHPRSSKQDAKMEGRSLFSNDKTDPSGLPLAESVEPVTSSATAPSETGLISESAKVADPDSRLLEQQVSSKDTDTNGPNFKGDRETTSAVSKEDRGSMTAISKEDRGSSTAVSKEHRGSMIAVPKEDRESSTAVSKGHRGSMIAVPKEHRGSSTAVSKEHRGSMIAVPKEHRGSSTAVSKEHRGSMTAVPKEDRGSSTAVSKEHRGSMIAVPKEHRGSSTAVSKEHRGSMTTVTEKDQGSRTELVSEKGKASNIDDEKLLEIRTDFQDLHDQQKPSSISPRDKDEEIPHKRSKVQVSPEEITKSVSELDKSISRVASQIALKAICDSCKLTGQGATESQKIGNEESKTSPETINRVSSEMVKSAICAACGEGIDKKEDTLGGDTNRTQYPTVRAEVQAQLQNVRSEVDQLARTLRDSDGDKKGSKK